MHKTLTEATLLFDSSKEQSDTILALFTREFEFRRYLKDHKAFASKQGYFFGEFAFHYLWQLLLESVGEEFSFLEIGVFKGQTISLIKLLSDRLGKKDRIVAVTPLSNAGDIYSVYPDEDYEKAIASYYSEFNLSMDTTTLVKGFSQSPTVIAIVQNLGPFEIVYIDGCHDYDAVISDISNYSPMVTHNGFLVLDDAATIFPGSSWRGHPQVGQAVADTIDKNAQFQHLFALGHIRVFKRL